MTEQQQQGNILIAEATGWKYTMDETNELYPMGYWSKGENEDWSIAEDLKFHSDWNWLMQAYFDLNFHETSTDIEQAFNLLVETIKAQNN